MKIPRSGADMPQMWTLDTDEQNRMFQAHVSMMRLAGKPVKVEFCNDEAKTRTVTQNAALHMWLEQVATTLNAAGLDMRAVMKKDMDIPWSKESAKEHLWRPVAKVLTMKDSTTESNTTDYNEICQAITRHLGQKLGVTLPPWPSYFNNEGDKHE
jgi:hypothetical protein